MAFCLRRIGIYLSFCMRFYPSFLEQSLSQLTVCCYLSKKYILFFLFLFVFFGHSQASWVQSFLTLIQLFAQFIRNFLCYSVFQYFTVAPTGNLSAQGFYLINRMLGTPLGQDRRKATARLGWNGSRGGEERLLQHGCKRNEKERK